MATLYLVGTPIGNLEDISLRALRVLRTVALIAAEDTRHTGRLLKHFDITTPMTSYHDFSRPEAVAALVARLDGGDVALVSDAGMPGISDPGYRLVNAALAAGHTVTPVPGPTALTATLVSSGLPTDRFLFLGFLPRQRQARRAALADVAALPATLVAYEAPHRLPDMLADALAVLGNRGVCIGRELTKLHEELWRGTLEGALAHFGDGDRRIRGEITVVLAGAEPETAVWDAERVRQALAEALAQGLPRKEAAAQVAARSGWRKRDLYQLTLES